VLDAQASQCDGLPLNADDNANGGVEMPIANERINRLTSASLDLENCIRFLDELDSHRYASTSYEALLLLAIIFYARPFSGNEKPGSTHPSESRVPDIVLSGLLGEERRLHEEVVTLRNKAVAHAEWSHHPTGVTDRGIIQAMPFSIWRYFQGNVESEKLKTLAGKVWLSVQHEQANELRKF